MSTTINERVRIVRKEKKMTLEQFGECLGLKKNSLSQIENGINNLTPALEKAICREFDVNPIWLSTGEGEMFVEPSFDDLILADELMKPENKSFLNLFKRCKEVFDKDDWEAVDRIIGKLSGDQTKKEE